VRLRVNGRLRGGILKSSPGNPRRLTGLVQGLRNGRNLLAAKAPGRPPEFLVLRNGPIFGPVFSGPHQMPFLCRTETNGLGPATDANCSAPTRVDYHYRTLAGEFKPLPTPTARPADMATTTVAGRNVDYRVRLESGTINRAVYRWAVLDPGDGSLGSWNRRFIYSHRGGCSAGHQQGLADTEIALDHAYLRRGFVVMGSSLNVFQTACNDVLSAETASMVKEHVIESLGAAPVWTIGAGGSGGAIQVQMNSQNYPGLFDGIIPTASFPDNSLMPQPDCRLLYNYFDSPAAAGFTAAQRVAVTGIPVEGACRQLGSTTANVINASEGCVGAVPPTQVFNPITNPDGIRCTIFESMVNVWGRDPDTGYARRALDNVGRQYGLLALQEGTISLNRFLDLNEGIGGFDTNGDFRASRTVADLDALRAGYRTGRVNRGIGGASGVPIIDVRSYVDDAVNTHISVPALEYRERLIQSNGTAANHVILRAKGTNTGPNVAPMRETAIDWMSEWLDRITSDRTSRPKAVKVSANRPPQVGDACWANNGQRYDEPAGIGLPGTCNQLYPPFSTPMMRAGAPLGHTVVKCQLKPLNPSDYGSPTTNQLNRLNAIFPSGVCDFDKPGVGSDEPYAGTWQSFGPASSAPNRARKLTLRVVARKRNIVRLSAGISPCPEATWHRVSFQRRAAGSARWRAVGTASAKEGRCRALVTVRAGQGKAALRALARATGDFRPATSRVLPLRPRTTR